MAKKPATTTPPGYQKSVRFNVDEIDIVEQAIEKHGSFKAAVFNAMVADLSGASPENVPAELRRLAKLLEAQR